MKGLLLFGSLLLGSVIALTAFSSTVTPLWLAVPAAACAAVLGAVFVTIQWLHVTLDLLLRLLLGAVAIGTIGLAFFAMAATQFEQLLPWAMVIAAILALGTATAAPPQLPASRHP